MPPFLEHYQGSHYYSLCGTCKSTTFFFSLSTSKALYILYNFTPCDFLTAALAGSFHWSMVDSKSPQVPGTLLSIRASLNNAVVLDGPDSLREMKKITLSFN